jgi:poly-gamma-glutamate synthesis protein (capsule biosynthesis protein)
MPSARATLAVLVLAGCARPPEPAGTSASPTVARASEAGAEATPEAGTKATSEAGATPKPAAGTTPKPGTGATAGGTALPSAPSAPPRKAPARLPAGLLAFTDACSVPTDRVVTIAAIGDVLMHHELQKQAYASPDGFGVLWSGVADLLARTDLTYANLEVPIATGLTKDGPGEDPGKRFDNAVYTGYPFFNAHPSLASDLAKAGVDIVSTANNHALDRGSDGLVRTLDALDGAKILHAGTRRTADEPWHAETVAKGMRIAWLACTLHTNFGKDDRGQVLHCFKQTDLVLDQVKTLAARDDIDAVIVTPHWGKEYDPVPQTKQRELAERIVDAGATAVIGAHPHVLQPWEKVTTKDGREAFVHFSLGNFAHHQRSLDRRSSIILVLGLAPQPGGKAKVVGARYIPINVRMEGDKEAFFVEAVDRVGGPADVRALVTTMYGEANLMRPDDALDVASYCVGGGG